LLDLLDEKKNTHLKSFYIVLHLDFHDFLEKRKKNRATAKLSLQFGAYYLAHEFGL